ncbi:glycosyltransferase family protein [Paracoccus ravus]|uniref:glycosyltransferase family protein n=1 Tax=Paracoccus ravus TaxID=2447760 RepID=UPI001ADBBBE5|nr:glycosyltransferase [Paracoccus ravus]
MTRNPARPRILFYVQHLLGIGHLARASRIAQALSRRGAEITLVTGGLPVPGFPPPGLAHIALPPVQMACEGFAGLADAQGRPVQDDFLKARRDLLCDAFRRLRPDIVLTEAFPFGRRQMRFELLPLLDAIETARPRPVLFCSLRDIVQEKAKPGRAEETVALIHAHYDGVLIHGDPTFARLEDSFPLAGQIADRLTYTGLVAPPPPRERPEGFDTVTSAGGGAVGAALARAALEAAAILPPGLRHCIICGPNLPQPQRDELMARAAALSSRTVKIETFRPDFVGLLAASRLSVSQAGYNTVCDLLRAGCHAILVPFAAGGETEQATRARRLAQIGRATVLPEDGLSGQELAAAISAALVRPRSQTQGLDLDGAEQTANILYNFAEYRRPV